MKNLYVLFSGAASASVLSDPSDTDRPVILTEVVVHPDDRGKGWGSAVLKLVCEDADREGITLVLSVEPGPTGLSYEALKAWYERYGFTGDTEDDVMVRLPITGQ